MNTPKHRSLYAICAKEKKALIRVNLQNTENDDPGIL